MKFCSYTVKYDTGFVPNPFWGYCTLAHCTPNHMGVQLSSEDWVMGTSDSNHGNSLVYAMEVSERIHFNDYFHDVRFQKKKPDLTGNWKKQCGDNIYQLSSTGQWQQAPSLFHTSQSEIIKDTKHPYVYVSEKFWYFGENSIEIPAEFQSLIWKRQGCKTNYPLKLVKGFTNWIEANFEIGIHGLPRDREKFISCGKKEKEKSSRTKRCT